MFQEKEHYIAILHPIQHNPLSQSVNPKISGLTKQFLSFIWETYIAGKYWNSVKWRSFHLELLGGHQMRHVIMTWHSAGYTIPSNKSCYMYIDIAIEKLNALKSKSSMIPNNILWSKFRLSACVLVYFEWFMIFVSLTWLVKICIV